MKRYLKRKSLFCAMLLTPFVAFAQTSVQSVRWDNFGGPIALQEVSPGMAGAVVYRSGLGGVGTAVNVYVNGEYLTSLQENGYKYTEVCPANQRLSAGLANGDNAYQQKIRGQFYDLPVGMVSFFKVVMDGSGMPTLLSVDSNTARHDMAGLRQQTHTLPRLSPVNCGGGMVMSANTSAYFEYNRSDYAGILPESKEQLQQVIRSANNRQVQSIHLHGHADPQGSSAYNEALAKKRAHTVKRVLSEGGVPIHTIQTQSSGERNPVVADCAARYPAGSAAQKQCNQPNRRVDISAQ